MSFFQPDLIKSLAEILQLFTFPPLHSIPIIKLFHKKRYQNNHLSHTLTVLTLHPKLVMLFRSDVLFL